MAAAVFGRTEVGVEEFGRNVDVKDDPKAKLMYYFDCMCYVLDMSATANLRRLRNYRQSHQLSEEETDALVSLCFLLSPDELCGKVIFQDDDMCGYGENAFFKINAVRHNLVVSESIIIGGQRRAVFKIMAFRRQWLTANWVEPMQHFAPRLARIATGIPRPRPAAPVENARPRPTTATANARPRPAAPVENARPRPTTATGSARPRPAAPVQNVPTTPTSTPSSQQSSSSSRCAIM